MGRLVRHGQVWFVKSYAGGCGLSESDLRLRKEYEILLRLNHPGIVRAGWLEELPGLGLGLIMEMAEGETLDKFLDHASRTERRMISDLLLRTVAYIHLQGVCHLDLKPQNILVAGHDRSVRIKIVDFGMSDFGGSAVFKNPGGTRGFSDPEQFKPGYEATPRSDVYALGRLLEIIDGGRDYKAVAKVAMQANLKDRPEDGTALIELVKRRRRRRLCEVAVICAVVTGLGMVPLFIKEHRGDTVAPQITAPAESLVVKPETPEPEVDTPVVRAVHPVTVTSGKAEAVSVPEYDRLVAIWNVELEKRLNKMKEIAACDTVAPDVRRQILENMYEKIVEDTREFFRPYVEKTDKSEAKSHPMSWASIYDPGFVDVRRRMTAVYETL